MVNYDLISIVIFYCLVILFYFKNKSKFEVQGGIIFLYRTQIGLKLMDRIAKAIPRFWKVLAYPIITVGFAGMFYILFWITVGVFKQVFFGGTPPLAPVLPGVSIPGLPNLSFWHWIIAIFAVVVVHEFMHGVYARVENLKVKSSGFGFFGPIPLAFVEPDEKEMVKRNKKGQLAILAAGAFTNVVFALLFLVIFSLVTTPLYNSAFDKEGIKVEQVNANSPARDLDLPFVITQINGEETSNAQQFANVTSTLEINQTITLTTDNGEVILTTISNPKNDSRPYIGIEGLSQNYVKKENTSNITAKIISWLWLLSFWLFVVNLGVGLFNLLPLGPVDGGKMFYTLMLAIFRNNEKIASKVWGFVSWYCVLLIVIGLLPYLIKLFSFLVSFIV